ncbi:MAG: hypothetical protein M3R62_15465 [Acidobacteriota bacterium]|nr:hypothetical protein [Acidobacteriota bacterium]MDQ2980606.1 hypothetical protein [Acidobacteriota bacterium]
MKHPGQPPLALKADIQRETPQPGRPENQLRILLRNDAGPKVSTFRVELQLPTGAVEKPPLLRGLWLSSSGGFDRFRITESNQDVKEIFPFDEKEVFRIRYSTQRLARRNRQATITLHLEGFESQEAVLDL